MATWEGKDEFWGGAGESGGVEFPVEAEEGKLVIDLERMNVARWSVGIWCLVILSDFVIRHLSLNAVISGGSVCHPRGG